MRYPLAHSAPINARKLPSRGAELGVDPGVVDNSAIPPVAAIAIDMPNQPRHVKRSPNSQGAINPIQTGFVVTSNTEAATLVCSKLVIHDQKWTPIKKPAPINCQRWRGDNAQISRHLVLRIHRGKSKSREKDTRQKAMVRLGISNPGCCAHLMSIADELMAIKPAERKRIMRNIGGRGCGCFIWKMTWAFCVRFRA